MNLFDNIIQSQFNNFTGKQAQPQVPSFWTPQAPRTSRYVAPNVPIKKESTSLFPQASAWTPIVTDDEIKQMIDKWASDDEIKILISELEKERGWATPQAPQPEMSFGEKAWQYFDSAVEWGKNILWGIVSEIPKVAWNIAWEVSNLWAYSPWAMLSAWIRAPFVKETYWELREQQKTAWEQLKKLWAEWKKAVESTWLYNPESTWAKIWSFWTDILATVVWPWKIFKTAEKASAAIKALAWLANVSTQWTTAAVSNYVTTEWRLPTAKEVAEFVAIQWGLWAIWGLFKQIKKLPSARLIPTTITEAWKDIRKWIDVWEAISTTGISFTKKQLQGKIEAKVRNLSWKVDDAINTVIEKTWPNNITIPSLTKWLKKEIMEDATIKAQLKGTPIQMKQIEETIDETITSYNSLYKWKKFDLNAQQQLKKDIYTGLENVFNKNFQTTGKITAQQATERQIARKLRTNIETKVPEVTQLNKELAPFLEAWKRLSAKGGYSGYLTDILAWWFASWNPQWIIQDPVWYAKNFLFWVIAKRAWTSTLAKTTASTLTAKIESLFKNPTFQKAILDQYRQSNQK